MRVVWHLHLPSQLSTLSIGCMQPPCNDVAHCSMFWPSHCCTVWLYVRLCGSTKPPPYQTVHQAVLLHCTDVYKHCSVLAVLGFVITYVGVESLAQHLPLTSNINCALLKLNPAAQKSAGATSGVGLAGIDLPTSLSMPSGSHPWASIRVGSSVGGKEADAPSPCEKG